VSLFQIYLRALQHLAPVKKRVLLISAANVVLAFVTIAEPILFGRIIDSITANDGLTLNIWLWAGLSTFNIVAYVMIARGSDRLAHERRAGVLVESFARVISMPLSWHHQRGTSHVLHTLLRAVEAMFGLWLEFMRQQRPDAVDEVALDIVQAREPTGPAPGGEEGVLLGGGEVGLGGFRGRDGRGVLRGGESRRDLAREVLGRTRLLARVEMQP